MKVILVEDYQTMSKKAANIVESQIILKPHSVLGLATGETVVGMYKEIVKSFEMKSQGYIMLKREGKKQEK